MCGFLQRQKRQIPRSTGCDFAKDEVNALVVPPRNPKAAAKAVLRLLSDDGLAERIREKGLKTAKNFTWSKAVDKVEKIFLKCV